MTTRVGSSFLKRPKTRPSWWAVGLAAAFVVLFIINTTVLVPASEGAGWRQTVLPFFGILMMLCGLVGGIVGLISVVYKHERAWPVWLSILPGAFVFLFLLGEFLVLH